MKSLPSGLLGQFILRFFPPKNFSILAATAMVSAAPLFLQAQDVRVVFDNTSGDNEFTNRFNWFAFSGADRDQLPGFSAVGAPSNAIIQGAGPVNLNSAFTPANAFSILIIRNGQVMNAAADLNIAGIPMLVGQAGGSGTLNQSAGTVSASNVTVDSGGLYNLTGGAINFSGNLTLTASSTFRMQGNTATAAVGGNLTVGAGDTLDFIFGPAGINPITVSGDFAVDPGSTINVDGTAYAGAPGDIDLVQFATTSGGLGTVVINGFNPALYTSSSVGIDSDSLFVSLGAPAGPGAPVSLIADLGAITQLEQSAIPMNLTLGQIASNVHGISSRSFNQRLYRLRARHAAAGREIQASRSLGGGRSYARTSTIKLSGQSRASSLKIGSTGGPIYSSFQRSESYSASNQPAAYSKNPNVVASGDRWRLFASGDFGAYELDSLSGSPGLESDTYTASTGFEYDVSDRIAVGLTWSHVWSDNTLTNGLGSVDIEGDAVMGYVSYFRDNFWGDLAYSHGSYEADISRNTLLGSRATARPDIDAHQTSLNLGYNLSSGRKLTHGPTFRADYNWGEVDGYTETGSIRGNTTFDEQDFESLITTLGWQFSLREETSWGALQPNFRIGYGRENLDRSTTVSGTLETSPFAIVQGATRTSTGGRTSTLSRQDPGESWMEIGAGVGFEFNSNFGIYFDYQGRLFQENATLHLGSATATWRF